MVVDPCGTHALPSMKYLNIMMQYIENLLILYDNVA